MEAVVKARLSTAERALVELAEDAVARAYAPRTGVQVGAAVLTPGGAYGGCNVESVISGLGICAERSAVNHAVLHEGPTLAIRALAVAWTRRERIRPCGACLQYLSEFAAPEARILMAAPPGAPIEVSCLGELLPYRYAFPGGR